MLRVLSSPLPRRILTRTHSSSAKPFETVLIANRGEIASRIMRTCRQLGIRTVGVYSTADAQAPFVDDADEAICIGPPAADQSYLKVDAILEAIHKTGADAVHPGYGFLSENAAFAAAIGDSGAVWLGPPPSAVEQLGDKLASKHLAHDAEVDTIPGHDRPVESLEEALELCRSKVPYPVLLKAAAGGGGKGMRVCHNEAELKDAWGIAKSEAKKFFSDDRVLIEKYIENPHHIEFQVLCDRGAKEVVVLPERECSIQRRNQKVIEESPSMLLTEETRLKMAEQVTRLCQAAGYESAGTVEFLVDDSQSFYFLEMNTRLQVEHPVSEAICGVDLVKGMLWVGAGWGLPEEFQRESPILPYKGHAMEARIYAEDPQRGFLPSTGPLQKYAEPSLLGNTPDRYLRMDAGVAAGSVVSPHYDPMLAKVIGYGQSRRQAIDTLTQALDEYVIEGVQHNARLVQSVLREPDFVAGKTPTSFLDRHYPNGFHGVQLTPDETLELVVAGAQIAQERRALLQQPELIGDGLVVKLGGWFGPAFKVALGSNSATVVDLDADASSTVRLDARVPVTLEPERWLAHLSLNGRTRTLQVLSESLSGELQLQMYGHQTSLVVMSEREYELSLHMHEPPVSNTENLVMSPMPGTLISFAVQAGDSVEIGQELCIVEAMKMQNIVRSPRAGVIGACKVEVGASLAADEVLIEFVAADQQAAA